MEYYINIGRGQVNNAWSKAPKDICEICNKRGMVGFNLPTYPKNKPALYRKAWSVITSLYYWLKFSLLVKNGDVILFQHPIYGIYIANFFIRKTQHLKKCRFIALIHDLDSIRKQGRPDWHKYKFNDDVLLKQFDVIISHNEQMTQYLINQGFDGEKIVNLEIFDYLSNNHCAQKKDKNVPSIAITGNLIKSKSKYVYGIFGEDETQNSNLIVHLYGNGFDETKKHKNMVYHGAFSAEKLPDYLEGAFGLVWDGTSPKTCAGNTGEYLKYNNPHKASCYLSAGMPVIVWSKSAIADFVLKNKVGITVDSLYELEKKINEVSSNDYAIMCENAMIIGEKLKQGFYFNKALSAAKALLQVGDSKLGIKL